jgi:peptide-methionine (S)-S-oxide reductase
LEAQAGKPVYIAVEPFEAFYTAEEYHQNYDLKNPEAFRKELMESGRMKENG